MHFGHINIAEKAMDEFDLDSVIFIPTGIPPHKKERQLTNKKDRLAMVKLAVTYNPDFYVSPVEINRPGYSYAVETFEILRKKFGKDTKLYYIMGADSLSEVLTWKSPLKLFNFCDFIVATRPGTTYRLLKRITKFPPLAANKDKIHLIETNYNISSTEIRQRLSGGASVQKLVPAAVINYIKKGGLYEKSDSQRK